ncbi:MAG: ferritin-like domain-containing protein [Campylobacterales bacterium]|nr:ferritin-like domain-containing protein [Campylobacterales bacterium]
MNFYSAVCEALRAESYQEKTEKTLEIEKNFLDNKYDFTETSPPLTFEKPSYEVFLNPVPPKKIPKAKDLQNDKGMGEFLHSIVHIEYCAIDLALDACYRFRNMPHEFYKDWIEVAREEVEHFTDLRIALEECGYKYGDLPVHNYLWEATLKTPDLLERMAFIPRNLEANGLDVNTKVRTRVENSNHKLTQKILKALDIILRDEIDHVRKGDVWFKYACKKKGKDPKCYFEIIESLLPNSSSAREINIEARKKAGFTCDELSVLSTKKPC